MNDRTSRRSSADIVSGYPDFLPTQSVQAGKIDTAPQGLLLILAGIPDFAAELFQSHLQRARNWLDCWTTPPVECRVTNGVRQSVKPSVLLKLHAQFTVSLADVNASAAMAPNHKHVGAQVELWGQHSGRSSALYV